MPSFAGARELGGLLGLGRNLLGGAGLFTGFELFNQGRPGSLVDKGVQNLPGIIPDPRTDVGRNFGNSLGNQLRYMAGQAAQGKIPYTQSSNNTKGTRPVGTQAVLNGKPVYWGGDDYGWQLLNQTGSSATLNSLNVPGTQNQFIQDSFSRSPGGAPPTRPPGTGSFTPLDPYAAQNREYERERARVEAMVKANPDMQKQAIADERAKVRDQGMAIWAQKNPELAKQVKPGAVGYDAIQRGIGIQSIPSIENRAEFSWNQATQGPTPAVPMADAMLNPASPSFIGGEGPPPVNFADPRFENMSPEEFQKLLNQYTKR
jgi:hypothetical protein